MCIRDSQYTFISLGGHSPHAGHSGSGPVLRIENTAVTLDHVTISDNPGKIMQAVGADLTIRDSTWPARPWARKSRRRPCGCPTPSSPR